MKPRVKGLEKVNDELAKAEIRELRRQLDLAARALTVALHYTEASYDTAGAEALIGCRMVLLDLDKFREEKS